MRRSLEASPCWRSSLRAPRLSSSPHSSSSSAPACRLSRSASSTLHPKNTKSPYFPLAPVPPRPDGSQTSLPPPTSHAVYAVTTTPASPPVMTTSARLLLVTRSSLAPASAPCPCCSAVQLRGAISPRHCFSPLFLRPQKCKTDINPLSQSTVHLHLVHNCFQITRAPAEPGATDTMAAPRTCAGLSPSHTYMSLRRAFCDTMIRISS